VWRAPDTDENNEAFAKTVTQHGKTGYPQVRMDCQMELTSHLLTNSVFDCVEVNK
jgi:hypothetical protein